MLPRVKLRPITDAECIKNLHALTRSVLFHYAAHHGDLNPAETGQVRRARGNHVPAACHEQLVVFAARQREVGRVGWEHVSQRLAERKRVQMKLDPNSTCRRQATDVAQQTVAEVHATPYPERDE